MIKPLEQMEPSEIYAIKQEIAEACGISVDNVKTSDEVGQDSSDFFVNHGSKDYLEIFLNRIWIFLYRIRFEQCIFMGDITMEDDEENLCIESFVFLGCVFKKRIGVYGIQIKTLAALGCEFEDDVDFMGVKIENLRITSTFKKKTSFVGCNFKVSVNFQNSTFLDNANFAKSNFCKDDSSPILLAEEMNFQECKFMGGVDFSYAVFHDSVYFDWAKFEAFASFRGVIFKGIACFYGAIFKSVPNFGRACFEKSLSLVNTKLDFGISILIREVQVAERSADNYLKTPKNRANDYRDNFRLLKNCLIKDGNMLDASQYHKMELYCKEIEFLARIKEAICPQKIKENGREKTLSSAEQSLLPLAMDFLQLWFYRKTSDHHTDLLRIIAWVVACIGLFGYVLLGIFASDKEIAISWFGVSRVLSSVDSWIVSVGCLGIVVVCLLVRWVEWLVGGIGSLLGVWILTSRPSYLIDLFKGSLLDGCFDRWQNATLLVHVILLGLLLFSFQETVRKTFLPRAKIRDLIPLD